MFVIVSALDLLILDFQGSWFRGLCGCWLVGVGFGLVLTVVVCFLVFRVNSSGFCAFVAYVV